MYRTRAIITHCLYIFYPILESQKRFLRSFFHKSLPLCMISIQERFIIKRAYGKQYIQQFIWFPVAKFVMIFDFAQKEGIIDNLAWCFLFTHQGSINFFTYLHNRSTIRKWRNFKWITFDSSPLARFSVNFLWSLN